MSSIYDKPNQKIIIGGWTTYAEEHGVNKKEPVETFDWLPSQHDAFAYKDLKNALDKVDGARQWLKTYVKKSRHDYSFSDLIGDQIRVLLTVDHSGASGTGLMWDYKRLLNDWDAWVFAKKRYSAMESYKKGQINPYTVDNLLWRCDQSLEKDGQGVQGKQAISAENILKFECSKYNHQFTSVPDLKQILTLIKDDWDVIMEEDRKEYNEGVHRELIESIEFLYEHPSRWFDSPRGCGLSPAHPSRITERAMNEMETKYPGYKDHIAAVLRAMPIFPWTREFALLDWTERSEGIKDFMHTQGIVAGVLAD
jgi:hypothetical protein